MRLFRLLLFVFGLWGLATGCEGPDTPLDADTRQRIDSLSNAEIRRLRIELDSVCAVQERTVLPRLVDSFQQVRRREIEEQLKTLPRE